MKGLKKLELEWLEHPIYINEDGTVIYYNGKYRKPFFVKGKRYRKGYMRVKFDQKQFNISRLVAMAFVENPNNYGKAMHLNSNTLDNHYKNLKWGTMRQVYQTSVKNGLKVGKGNRTPWKITQRDSNNHYKSAISYTEALKIARRLDKGEHANKICKEYGVSEMAICRIRKRYCKKKQASPRYSQETKDKAASMLRGGYPATDVANIFGISYETIWRWDKAIKHDNQRSI